MLNMTCFQGLSRLKNERKKFKDFQRLSKTCKNHASHGDELPINALLRA